MISYPYLQAIATSSSVVDKFYGYDHEDKIPEGAFWDTQNLTADKYPMMATREKRKYFPRVTEPQGILGKANLAVAADRKLYYNGEEIKGLYPLLEGEKKMVSMGAYICIWPDKVWLNTAKTTEYGRMENSFTSTEGGITVYPSLQDSTEISITRQEAEPENPTNGMYWLDTSAKPFSLKLYSAATKTWAAVVTTYVTIQGTGIDGGFSEGDGIEISGLTGSFEDLNGYNIIQSIGQNRITIIGMASGETSGLSCKVARTVPELDFVTEAQNRIWGCFYGLSRDGSQTLNEIYCCALGDFKNWRKYEGISTDSYTASCGTDGPWTGAITHMGYPLFFKEKHLHKVYISTSGAHQIVDTECRGVQMDCWKSMAIVDNVLYYKSRDGICAYDGSMPQPAGTVLGSSLYYKAVGGSIGSKYYVSMEDGIDSGEWALFCLDTSTRIWLREDDTHALMMARCRDDLFIMTAEGDIFTVNGTEGQTPEGDIRWKAETGIIGYGDIGHKYISRFNIRMKLPRGSRMQVMAEYDSDGVWRPCGNILGRGLNTFLLPVRPRRCDHFRLKLEGTGEAAIYSFAKVYESGSDGG